MQMIAKCGRLTFPVLGSEKAKGQMLCPICQKSVIPTGFSKPSECKVSFNPSRRNSYDKIHGM